MLIRSGHKSIQMNAPLTNEIEPGRVQEVASALGPPSNWGKEPPSARYRRLSKLAEVARYYESPLELMPVGPSRRDFQDQFAFRGQSPDEREVFVLTRSITRSRCLR